MKIPTDNDTVDHVAAAEAAYREAEYDLGVLRDQWHKTRHAKLIAILVENGVAKDTISFGYGRVNVVNNNHPARTTLELHYENDFKKYSISVYSGTYGANREIIIQDINKAYDLIDVLMACNDNPEIDLVFECL